MGKSNYEVYAEENQPKILAECRSKEFLLGCVNVHHGVLSEELLREVWDFAQSLEDGELSFGCVCNALKERKFSGKDAEETARGIVAYAYDRIPEEVERLTSGDKYWIV